MVPLSPIFAVARCFSASLDGNQGHLLYPVPGPQPCSPSCQVQLTLTGAWKASVSLPKVEMRKQSLRQTHRGTGPFHHQQAVGLESEAESCLSGLMLPDRGYQMLSEWFVTTHPSCARITFLSSHLRETLTTHCELHTKGKALRFLE